MPRLGRYAITLAHTIQDQEDLVTLSSVTILRRKAKFITRITSDFPYTEVFYTA